MIVCKHKILERSCVFCDMEKEIAELRAENEHLKKESETLNAQHIVHAINMLPELIAILEKIEICHSNGDHLPMVEIDELIKGAKRDL